MVHEESLAYAEEWLERLAHGSVSNKGKPLAPRTIDRYRDVVIGRPRQESAVPFLAWWGAEAPGEPIWAISKEAMLEFLYREVRDGHGGTKEPSASEVNNRRSAVLNFIRWLHEWHSIAADREVRMYQPAVEDRAETRRKQVKLNPLRDEVFSAIWVTTDPIDNRDNLLWLGMAAFMGMRIDEMADLRPGPPPGPGEQGVDLERRFATFMGKGRKLRTVHYGDLLDDWSYLPHLRTFPQDWVKSFEDHVAQRQVDAEAMPPKRTTDAPWWVLPHTEGEMRPHRDNPRRMVWASAHRDRAWFDRRWQELLVQGGFAERQFTPHQLRHFVSTNLWRAGTPWLRIVTEMGHDEGATTIAYSDFNPAFSRERARNERKRGEE